MIQRRDGAPWPRHLVNITLHRQLLLVCMALVTKSCRSRPAEKSGSPPDPHSHDSARINLWNITMLQSSVTCASIPTQEDRHQPHPSHHLHSTQTRQVTPLFTSCVYFSPLHCLAYFWLTLHLMSSLLSDTHTAPCIFSAQTYPGDGYTCALTSAVAFIHEEKEPGFGRVTGASTKHGRARMPIPLLS